MLSRRTTLAVVAVLAVWGGAGATFAAPATSTASAQPSSPLTTAAAVHSLSAAQAAGSLPVRLRAVVTFVNEDGQFLFVQDADEGIFVDATDAPSPPAKPGDLAVIEGVTAPGLFAPQIRLKRLTVDGKGPMPTPRQSSYAEMASGQLDCSVVAVEGTVRAVALEPARPDKQYRLVFNLAVGGGTFQIRVHVADPSAVLLDGLIDATVALRGVCGGIFNSQRQLIGIVLHAPDASAITITQPSPTPDPFAQGPKAIQSLFQFSPHARINHRVRVDGTVAYRQPGGAMYLWDGTAGVLVQTAQLDALAVGDQVQVVGFPVMGEWTPVLEDAIFRRVRPGSPPTPIKSTAAREATTDGHDARLVTLEGTLIDVIDHHRDVTLALYDGNVVFDAEVPAPRTGGRLELERGSRLRLTGISVARADNVLKRPTGFKLLLRAPGDLQIVSRASWWTLQRLVTAVAALAAFLALVVAWVVVLRRRVHDQTEIIRAQIQREAALEDRYRDLFENANDIVFAMDRRGRLTAINRAAEEITGFRRAELLAGGLLDFVAPDRREEARRLFERLFGGEDAPPRFETALLARDGRRIALEVVLRPTLTRGQVTGFDGIARDVSAREAAAAELAAANGRMVELSRRAGMAEVASSVLHNVGNVLNTVNTSTAMLAEKLRDSRAANVARAVDLLDASPMERAKVMTYLKGAAAELVGERGALQGEVETLARSVEHIKEIVAVQQGYARAPGGTEETLSASAVLAEALRMLGDSPVEIVRDLADDPTVTVEKHKVVQILINLLRNARQACQEKSDQGGDGPRVTVRVERAVPGRLRFTVRDNGVGIAPETLARVFEHGFTTRKDGHGFGLHGAALMARELGGALEAASEGPGRGATFILDLPLVAAARRRTPRPLESAG